jgi:sulfide:quinone oxidoreductase
LFFAYQQHLYQPGLTLAAVGLMDQRSLVRSEHSVLPRGVHWLQSGVAKFQPALNQLRLADADSTKVSYDFLVIATGIELRFDLVRFRDMP